MFFRVQLERNKINEEKSEASSLLYRINVAEDITKLRSSQQEGDNSNKE